MESSYPSNKKRSNEIEDTTYIHTADKSRLRDHTEDYLNRTPSRNQYTLSHKKDRTSQAKRAIDEVIEMVADKKRMNEEAISEIQQVNNEVAMTLSHKKVEQKRKESEHGRNPDSSRDYVATSVFDWRQSHEELQRSQKESETSQENLNLRSRLNDEIRKNNELYKKIAFLQAQNSNLRTSRASQAEHSLAEENRALREQIHLLQSQQGGNVALELHRLKQENSELRKETIALLQSK